MPEPRISESELIDGGFYRVEARNFNRAVYVKSWRCFIGVRFKFETEYLFTEFDYETGPPCGTVFPIEFLEHCPVRPIAERLFEDDSSNRELFDWLKAAEQRHPDKIPTYCPLCQADVVCEPVDGSGGSVVKTTCTRCAWWDTWKTKTDE
jgi:hypothetical protein